MTKEHRASNDYVVRTREVRSFTGPVSERIGVWQSKIALLRGVAEHREAQKRADLAAQLDELTRTISEQKQAFDSEVAGLSAEIADHDRIRDARKALENSAEAVEKIRTLLQKAGPPLA